MYLKACYHHHSKNQSLKEYKELLKDLTNLNLRRISKFNALAMYGALQCVKHLEIPQELDIYSSSRHGAIKDIAKALKDLNSPLQAIMPFDFLNISSSNIGFYLSKTLNSVGNNISIYSKEHSLQRAFELAFYALQNGNSQNILLGYIDEALEDVNNKEVISNKENYTYDISTWFLLSMDPKNALIKITDIKAFENVTNFKKSCDDFIFGT